MKGEGPPGRFFGEVVYGILADAGGARYGLESEVGVYITCTKHSSAWNKRSFVFLMLVMCPCAVHKTRSF
jgi:hypothetical protein